jgi:hypothetical protein
MGALVSDFRYALAAEAKFHRSWIGDRFARSAGDFLVLLVMELLQGETGEEPSDTSRSAAGRCRGFGPSSIEEHLMDPDLSPRSIARAHHICVRTCMLRLSDSQVGPGAGDGCVDEEGHQKTPVWEHQRRGAAP